MINISGYGLKATIVAVQTFPSGFTVKSFADSTNALTFEIMEPVGYKVLFDGSLFCFDKGAPVIVSIGVLPQTDDDINLKLLLTSKKSTSSWAEFLDITSMVVNYPDGGKVVLSNGSIISGPVGDTVLASGRRDCNVYKFAFGTVAGLQSTTETIGTTIQALLSAL